jgi:rhodanese-related sulfurtransferase
MLSFFKKIFGPSADFKELVANGALIIDVRTPQEYRGGHINRSQNIPLDQIKSKIPELKKAGKPVITVCKSGARSSMAVSILKAAGFEVYNGGSWNSLKSKIN